MKRIFVLTLLVLLASVLFAADIASFSALALTKSDTINLEESQRVALGVGAAAKYHLIEDSMVPPFTYGLYANADVAYVLDAQKGNEENADMNLEAGFSFGPVLAIDMEKIILTLSLGPSVHFAEHLNDNGSEIGESVSLGLFGDLMLYVEIFDGWGINAGVQSYWNLLSLDDDADGNSTINNGKHFVPAIYLGLSMPM